VHSQTSLLLSFVLPFPVDSEKLIQDLISQAEEAQRRANEADARSQGTEERLREMEGRLREMEGRLREVEATNGHQPQQDKNQCPFWMVEKSDIHLTGHECSVSGVLCSERESYGFCETLGVSNRTHTPL